VWTDRHVTKLIGTFRYCDSWPERELKLCIYQIFSFIDSMIIWSGLRLFRCFYYCVRLVILAVNFKYATDLDFV